MNVIVWGAGVSGLSALKFLKNKVSRLFVVQSGDPSSWKNLQSILEHIPLENCFSEEEIGGLLEKPDLPNQIILSPGVPRDKEEILPFIEKGIEVISDIELAYRSCSDIPIVAVTGSNGKTTTVTMISYALKIAGFRVFVGGNIGVPFCDFFEEKKGSYDYIILELSSFQLESLKSFHAHIAILLNISENHMERYTGIEGYKQAKLNIFNNQNKEDMAIVHKDYVSELDMPEVERAVIQKIKGIDLSKGHIYGDHNLENLFCVQAVLEKLKVKDSVKIIRELVESFRGVKFRQESLGEKRGTLFINDAKSTNIAATSAALRAFSGTKKIHLILGGKLRSEWQDLKTEVQKYEIEKVYAFGEARQLIDKELGELTSVILFKNLEDVVKSLCFEKNGVVLFSPGFPSFDLYQNYIERGEHFESLVSQI